MASRADPHTVRWTDLLGSTIVVCLFCAPLFIELAGQDLQNDEAIYSFAVDTIIETGDWMTPATIPFGVPFLEKPPLKFWMIAGGIRSGILPHDERGFRGLDALFGGIAFLYVFWFGRWLAGTICGLTAVLVLFTFQPLLFEHGFRSNNMEAALVLSFCGGLYHFARWMEARSGGHGSRAHALTVAAYFTLGFMTKFVAVLFLPFICALAYLWRRDALQHIGWSRDWRLPAGAAVAVIAPWFIYQSVYAGPTLWQTMFGAHVYQRFTDALDPRHLQPWHYYYSAIWDTLSVSRSQWMSAAGLALLGIRAWTGRPWLTRLLFLWAFVPLALISLGTSKILHYAYPFLPPLALGAGMVAAGLFDIGRRVIGAGADGIASLFPRAALAGGVRLPPAVRHLLFASAVLAICVSVWTGLAGQIRWEIDGLQILRNSSVVRPALIGAVLLSLSLPIPSLAYIGAVGIVAALLPLPAYAATVERTLVIDRPLRTFRDCALERGMTGFAIHIYPKYDDLGNHAYYYYLRRLGPRIEHDGSPKIDEFDRRLRAANEPGLMIVYRNDYVQFFDEFAGPDGLALSEDVVLLAPPLLADCAAAAVAAGGIPLNEPNS